MFRPGSTLVDVRIQVIGDDAAQFEAVVVRFDEPTNATLGGFSGLGLALIDPPGVDPVPTVSLSGLTASLSHLTARPVSADWVTGNFGSVLIPLGADFLEPLPGDDFSPPSGTVVFMPGQGTAGVALVIQPVSPPGCSEGDLCTYYVTLSVSSASNAHIAPTGPLGDLITAGATPNCAVLAC